MEFWYQLTNWYKDKTALDSVIEQIKEYEKRKIWTVKDRIDKVKDIKEYSVWTTGKYMKRK